MWNGIRYKRSRNSGCWRGYVGTWEIKHNKFYLNDVSGDYRMLAGAPLFAEWFSGMIRIPVGKVLNKRHIGYVSIHEKDILIQIEHGHVTQRKVINNQHYRIDQRKMVWRSMLNMNDTIADYMNYRTKLTFLERLYNLFWPPHNGRHDVLEYDDEEYDDV